MYHRIYDGFSFSILLRGQNGRILRHSRATSGSAGVISVKKPETRRQHIERVCTELKEVMRRLAAGQAVFTAENKEVDLNAPNQSNCLVHRSTGNRLLD
jgi:hypothetical protein